MSVSEAFGCCGVMVACSILCGRYATACCGTRALQGELVYLSLCVCVCAGCAVFG
jgi:hypothetical protein